MDIKHNFSGLSLMLLKLILALLVVISCLLLAIYSRKYVPSPPTCEKDSSGNFQTVTDSICVDRARLLLNKLCDLGPKPIGSYANEVIVPEILMSNLKSIQKQMTNNMHLELDIQMSDRYATVNNIVARLFQNESKSEALLINSHFDSSRVGPGASDDSINVVIMLEVLRSLAADNNLRLKYDIIFLFNDGEETFLNKIYGNKSLLGSRDFSKNHKWKDDVIAFVNLEAVGSGGKEGIYQSSSNDLMESYIKTARYPLANVMAQEVYRSGIIPSKTDFIVFHENLKVGGLDFAYFENGYVYHTKFDTADRIPDGSIMQGGDNILRLTKDFVSKRMDGSATKQNYTEFVYFDVLGLFMISYPWNEFGIGWNWFLSLATFGMTIVDMFICEKFGGLHTGVINGGKIELKTSTKAFLLSFVSLLTIWISSIGFSSLTASVMGILGLSMSWYSSTSFLFLLYSAPTLSLFFSIIAICSCVIHENNPIWNVMELFFFHAGNILIAMILVTLTACGIKSGYVLSISLFFNILWWIFYRIFLHIINCHEAFMVKNNQKIKALLFVIYLFFQIVPLLMDSSIFSAVMTLLIPSSGRFVFNADINPDLHIGFVVCISTLILLNSIFPLLLESKYNLYFASAFLLAFVSSIMILSASDIGFPFRFDETNPTTKRLNIFCAKRTFLGVNNTVSKIDTVYRIHRMDYTWSDKLLDAVPEYKMKKHLPNETDCSAMISCGFPDEWMTGFGFQNQGWLIDDSIPIIPEKNRVSVEKVSVVEIENNSSRFNLTMKINGPNDIFVELLTSKGVEIESSGPSYITKESLSKFRVFRRSQNLSPIKFWLILLEWKEEYGSLHLVAAGRSWNDTMKQGYSNFTFVDKHPQWVTPYVDVFDYKYYIF